MTNLPPHLQDVCDEWKNEPKIYATTSRGQTVQMCFQACFDAMVGDIEKLCDELGEKDAEVAELERAVVKHKANYEAANNESCEILKSEEKFRIKVTELVDALEAISKNIHPTNAWARIIANNILDKFKGGGE